MPLPTRRSAVRVLVSLSPCLLVSSSAAADPSPKRLLLVTHSGGFVHDSVGAAEDVLKEIGPKHGFAVTCWRYTGDPADPAAAKKLDEFRKRTGKPVEPENCGRINKDSLKNFDVVLFFTTGSKKDGQVAPLTEAELADLKYWIQAGGAFAGTHCATDTLYTSLGYGDLIGGYFKTHPPGLQKVKLRVDDPAHPAAAPFTNGQTIEDEIYLFQDAPYSRDKLHLILSIVPNSGFEPKNGRADGDYAISWCREEGKGKVFYSSLGHPKTAWTNPQFQQHLIAGLKWATGQVPGDATPSAKLKK
jgi:type 1 glutamine amidotransferase